MNKKMAKNLTYKKTTTEKVSIKGTLSADAKNITFLEDKVERTVAIQDYLDKFAEMVVEFSIACKSEEDLIDEDSANKE